MNENRETKRREWVKNAIIIFLVIMLLLTFFSNTIMNYSLPEVSAKYVDGGTLSEQIRGSGTIEANQSYDVKMGETRTIASVEVKVGDEIEKGQTLMKLEDSDSEELENAEKELDAAQKALREAKKSYSEALLSVGVDYRADELDIENQEETIAGLKEDLSKIADYQKAYDAAKEEVKSAQAEVRELEKENQKYQDVAAAVADENRYAELDEADYERITAAKRKLDNAEKAKAKTEENIKRYEAEIADAADTASIRKSIEEKQLEISKLSSQISREQMEDEPDYDKISELQASLTQANLDLKYLEEELNKVSAKATENARNEQKLGAERTTLRYNEDSLDKAQKAYNEVVDEIKRAANEKAEESENRLAEAKLRLEDAQAAEAEAKEKASVTEEEQEAKIREAETALEKAKIALSQKQKEDAVASGKSNLAIQSLQDGITDAEKVVAEVNGKIEKLKKNTIGAEITAPVGGKITSLGFVAGEEAAKESVAATIEMSEKGYAMSITVTAEQAKKVKAGDTAEVQYFWGGEANVVLQSVKPDEKNPAKSRILEFSVTGDVSPGQTLQISMGAKGQRYEYIVPNSSVREDNNGKFVLVVVAKSSPLGNRYTAERMSVEVLASDDTSSAVSGDFTGGEMIISTSSKPIEAGMQVRFAES
ncbi:MAG: hypothetical protein NC253_09880 [Ruminococcus sp.]|nr:hypothetical protein [Ruminococcus sp.]MCM1382137.1 hypothetical protein [Muribaculaceae bacterium]MCM1479098.1 hypothetical protein [Muribaculaceae bacterium]